MTRTYNASDVRVFDDLGNDPPFIGSSTVNSGNFRNWDNLGIYNPRALWMNIFDGPDSSWAATLYKVVNLVSGTPFVASVYWYRDAAKTKPVAVKTYGYTASNYVAPTTITYQLYNLAGTAVTNTCTDTLTYTSGTPFEASRTRVFS